MTESREIKEQAQKDEILRAIDVAKYFLILVDREAGDVITQLKLQKLMYLVQGIHLALYDKPLFKEEIEAWEHGPVVRELHTEFSGYGSLPIFLPYEINYDLYSFKIKQLIYKVYSIYGEHSSSYLYKLTHSHIIWQEAIKSVNKVIIKEKIRRFFKDYVHGIKEKFCDISQEESIKIEQEISNYENKCTNYLRRTLNHRMIANLSKIMLGTDDFYKLVVKGDIFVDKSLMIKELLENYSEAILIARPRRWGKSINMSMIQRFFEIEVDSHGNIVPEAQRVNKKLFLGGKINIGFNEEKQLKPLRIASISYAMKRQGNFPVIFLSLKDIKGSNYQTIEAKVREKITNVFEYHQYLTNSSKISDIDKQKFQDYLTNNITIDKLHSSLLFLSKLLFKHFKQKVYILIDEYDTPINNAYATFRNQEQGFKDVVELFRGILGACLKGNEYLEKGVITGILRIAKANLFSDLNNLTEYTVLDQNFAKFYGFTEQEVSELLIGRPSQIDQNKIKDWYNGYKIGGELVYNPWSIMQCISRNGQLDHYWLDSGGTDLIDKVLRSDDIQEDLQKLLENKKITKRLYKQISFEDIANNKNVFFSLLVFTGYLNAELDNNDEEYRLFIPNKEIRSIYVNRIKDWVSKKLKMPTTDYDGFIGLLTCGDVDKFVERLKEYFRDSTSCHDLCKERDYHNLMGGIFSPLSQQYIIESNIESGYGKFDHLLIARRDIGDKAFLIEYKVSEKEEELVKLAQVGLQQINNKAYDIA